VRFSTLAGQQSSVDVTTFFTWLEAVVTDIDRGDIEAPVDATQYEPTPGTLSGFTYERFRDEFRPAVDAWLTTNPFVDESAPASPFAMDEYRLAADAESQRMLQDAQDRASDAAQANQTSDNYVLSAVLFASALFFAALASKLVRARFKIASLSIAALLFLGTVVYVLTLPIEI
jgi:hypothetical protein